MADWTSIARPYAKAVFAHAIENKLVSEWSSWLLALDAVVSADTMTTFIDNPETTSKLHAEAVISVLSAFPEYQSELPKALSAFAELLATNKRLPLVTDIRIQYEALRAQLEARTRVEVKSFAKLSKQQLDKLQERLTKRLQKTVELDVVVSPEILGGAVISIPETDWVYDGSARGQLEKLGAELLAL